MFPSSALEKAEWRFLNLVDDFCNDQILRRLVVVVAPRGETDPFDEEKLKALARAVAKELADSITLAVPTVAETLYLQLFSKERVETLVAELYRSVLTETGKVIQGALTSEATGVKSLTAAIQEDTKKRTDETRQRTDAIQLQSDLVRKMGDSHDALVEAGRVIQGAVGVQASEVKSLTEVIQKEAKLRLDAIQLQSDIIRKMSDSQSALQACSESLQAAFGGISELVEHVDARRELASVQAGLQRVSLLLGGPATSEKSSLSPDGRGARG
jgi:hypothetical protein